MERLISGVVALVCGVFIACIAVSLYDVIGTTMTTQVLSEHDVSLEQAITAAEGAMRRLQEGKPNP